MTRCGTIAGATQVIEKTVLIADDTAFVRERFGAALGDAGHRAVLAPTDNPDSARICLSRAPGIFQ